MGAITTFAILTTGIAIGAAGHIALTPAPESSHTAAMAAPAVHASAAPRAEAQPVPAVLPIAPEITAPRECHPEEGVVTDCTYE